MTCHDMTLRIGGDLLLDPMGYQEPPWMPLRGVSPMRRSGENGCYPGDPGGMFHPKIFGDLSPESLKKDVQHIISYF